MDPYALLALLGFLVFLFYIIYNFLNQTGNRSFSSSSSDLLLDISNLVSLAQLKDLGWTIGAGIK